MRNRSLRDQLHAFVIQDMKMLAIETSHAAMTVAGIFAQTNIGNYRQIRRALFDLADRILHHAILGIRASGLFVLRLWNSKEQHGLHSRLVGALRDRGDFFTAVLVDAGHTRDRFRALDFFTDETWQDEVVPTKICFANEIANRGGAA